MVHDEMRYDTPLSLDGAYIYLTVISKVVPSDSETFYKKYVSFSISVGIILNRSNQILDMIIAISSELDSTQLTRL